MAFVIRPIETADLAALMTIAQESGAGFTSLPPDKNFLKQRIELSQASFAKQVSKAGGERYLFVMQDVASGEVMGTSAIEACVGLHSPLFHHRLGRQVHHVESLGLSRELHTLTLCNDLQGTSEVCSLFLRPKFRQSGVGRALSRFRFLFMAQHPHRFSDRVIAEMRGHTDDNDHSHFWSWFETHFCPLTFTQVDKLIGLGDMRFAHMMPKHPIYLSLLPKEAQLNINQVHPNTQGAVNLLLAEGFHRSDYIGVNDAGPALVAPLDAIETVRQSHLAKVKIVDEVERPQQVLLCNPDSAGFRAAQLSVEVHPDKVLMDSTDAKALKVSAGDCVRWCFAQTKREES
ncbi:arginine N-succinyltransferase [Paraferrimonas sedimenticola]|uniref:Arginine N-succinyltransferase n=1 Tax=Paraferrimonas sedimenticola TaxID=375674 RepID=A0AA37W178_9GAMM|nr:arginine N-succinyltransferase [Paraferrimonas sedimenticola]GLP96568.1 arginine N-succinyltransferase [Paraferrimonas sedimenticola]